MTQTFILFVMLATSMNAAALYASISGDANGVPRQVNLLDSATGSTTSPFALGDGSQGFIGGLAQNGDLYYSIFNDGFGNNTLTSFSAADNGSFNNIAAALNQGFYRGLTFNGDDSSLYGWFTPGFGPQQFVSINAANGSVSTLFSGPDAGFGGMTYRGGGIFDALFTNASGLFQLHQINAATGVVTPFGLAFSDNMNGGLAWSAQTNSLLAIGSDNSGISSLYHLAADGASILNLEGIGGGFFYGALVQAPGASNAIPEPSNWSTAILSCLFLGLAKVVPKVAKGNSMMNLIGFTALVLGAVATGGTAHAQSSPSPAKETSDPKNDWERVMQLRFSTQVEVIHKRLKRVNGSFYSATDTSLTVLANGVQETIQKSDVVRISDGGMPRRKRALIGAAIGAGVAVAGMALERSRGDQFGDINARGYKLGGAGLAGGLIGAGVGAATGGPQIIYRMRDHPQSSSASAQ